MMQFYTTFNPSECSTWNIQGDSKNKHYDIISTFDIETSNNGKFAWLILWQWYIDGVVYFGRTIEQLQDFIRILKENSGYKIITYVHNLSYEWQFIRKYFQIKNIFAMSKRKIYKCEIENIIFKDSLCLSGQSLEKTCKGLPIEKATGDWEYNIMRTPKTPLTPQELHYAENDVVCLAEYIKVMRNRYGSLTNIPMTKTGITRFNLRNYIETELKEKDTAQKGKSGYNYYYRYYIKNGIPDLNTFKFLRRAYWGGFTHASTLNVNLKLKNIDSWDISSSYPTVMIKEKFPYKFIEVSNCRFNYYFKNDYAILCNIRLTGFEAVHGFGYIPSYKCFEHSDYIYKPKHNEKETGIEIDNNKLFRCRSKSDYVILTVTEIDLKIIKQFYKYEKLEIIGNIFVSKKQYLPAVFRNFILKLYETKTTLKDVKGKEEEYALAKADVNCLYGMTVTDPVRTSYDIDDFNNVIIKETELSESELLKKAYMQHSHPVGLYQWGVYVSAYARQNLLNMIIKIDKHDFIYSDTDSIKIKNSLKYKHLFEEYNKQIIEDIDNSGKFKFTTHPKTIEGIEKPLGVYENEYHAKYFKCLRAKTYIYEVDKKLHCTVAGVPKKRIEKFLEETKEPFKNFNTKLFIPAEYDEKTQKLTSIYIDEEHSENINGEYITYKSGTILSPIEFSIQNDYFYQILFEHTQQQELHTIPNIF